MEKRILIVDDEEVILELLMERLSALGFTCVLARDEEEAIAVLEREGEDGPALLLTDIVMRGMGGIELAGRARALSPHIAVIVMTGKSDTETAVSALRAGADDYVLKPFDFEEMIISIDRALEKRRLLIENEAHEVELEQRVNEATEELEHSNAALRSAQEYLANLIDSTVDAILTINPQERVTFANQGTQRMLGYRGEEILDTPVSDLYIGGVEEAAYVRRVTDFERPLQNYETELKHRNGSIIPVSVSFSLVKMEEGVSMLAICKDITEQKRLELELKEMTIRDGLTGLYNLRHFYDRLEAEIERARRQHHPLSLLLLDVDHFKSYNDAHGHLEGDGVLREVSRVIQEGTREHVDLAFRYGGDEFTVILPEAPAEQAFQIAQRIRETFEALRLDLLTLSIGLMTYQDSFSARSFIQFTDSMMYDAKRSGGNQVYVYSAEEYV